jgi:hypothetical protein
MALATWWSTDPQPRVPALSGFEATLSTDDSDLAWLNRLPLSEVQARRQGGHRLYLGFLQGTPVAYGWVRYNGISLLSPQGIDTMHAFAPGFSYAMGWGNVSQNGERILYHNGDTLDSHSEMFIAPAHHWGIVLLLNEGDGIGYALSFTANRMAIGQQVLRLLEGQGLAPTGWSTNSYYLVIDSVLALIFALVLASFLRLPHWYKRFEQRSRDRLIRVSFRLLAACRRERSRNGTKS